MIDYAFKEELARNRERVDEIFHYEGSKVSWPLNYLVYYIR